MPISTINSKSIAEGTVVASDILDGTISSSKLVSANIAGDRLAANTLSNTVFQTGSVENYLRGASLDFGMRNRIINGAMTIDQRNSGASVTNESSGTQYTVDRWQIYGDQAAKFTVQQDSSANTVAGFTSSAKVTSLSSYSVGSGETFLFRQKIEGFNTADLGWGTASAKAVTISFWVRSSLTGTFGAFLINNGFNRSYPFGYTITSANTWEQKFITIPGDVTGTWATTNAVGIQLGFSLGSGSTFSNTANTWYGSAVYQPTGATSVVGTNGATWYITGVQLEEGSQATPFEYRQHGTELALCQRYYYLVAKGDATNIANGYYHGSTQIRSAIIFPTLMRGVPTLVSPTGSTFYFMEKSGSSDFFNSFTIYQAQPYSAVIYNASESSGTDGFAGNLVINGSTGYVAFSAEL
jgi:hypothetical protein